MKADDNEILTIAGERVEVRYSAKVGDCCYKCRFWSDAYGMCRAERADSTPPCQDYDSQEGGFAYFVRVKESQTTNAEEDKREFCKNHCIGYQETGRCFADGNCKAKQESDLIASFIDILSDVNKCAIATTFLKSEKAEQIIPEMYGNEFNNYRKKYMSFLVRVDFDNRFEELAGILQKYGAMPAPKEQPEADLEAEIDSYWNKVTGYQPPFAVLELKKKDLKKVARHFAEWGAKHLKK